MGGGGGGNTTTVQKSDPWKVQRPFLAESFDLAGQGLRGDLPRQLPGAGVAPFTPRQYALQEGMSMFGQSPLYQQTLRNQYNMFARNAWAPGGYQTAAQYAPQGQGMAVSSAGLGPNVNIDFGPGQDYSGFGGAGIGNPIPGRTDLVSKYNRKLFRHMRGQPNYAQMEGLARAATQPMVEQFQEEIMPSIRRGGIASGQIGGSRAGVAGGIAAGKLARAMGETRQRVMESERNRAFQNQQQAMSQMYGLGQQGKSLDFARQQLGVNTGANLAQQDLALGLQAEQIRSQGGLGMGNLALQQQQLAAGMAPQVMKTGMLPYQLATASEEARQQQMQKYIQDMQKRLGYEEKLPYAALDDYLRRIYGPGDLGGTTTGATQFPNQPSPATQAAVGLGGNAASTLLAYSLLK